MPHIFLILLLSSFKLVSLTLSLQSFVQWNLCLDFALAELLIYSVLENLIVINLFSNSSDSHIFWSELDMSCLKPIDLSILIILSAEGVSSTGLLLNMV